MPPRGPGTGGPIQQPDPGSPAPPGPPGGSVTMNAPPMNSPQMAVQPMGATAIGSPPMGGGPMNASPMNASPMNASPMAGPPISAVRMNLQRPPLPNSPSFHVNSSPRAGTPSSSSKGGKGGSQKRTEAWQKNIGGNRGTPTSKGGMGSGNAVRMTVPPAVSASSMGVVLPPDRRKRKLADKILAQKVRNLVPESQAYMDLLSFEQKLDATIVRKRLDIQEALKRPQKIKRKLRIFISHTFFPAKTSEKGEEEADASWELRVEGRLMDDVKGESSSAAASNKFPKRKFSSFFKSLVIELDKDLYGPDNHLVEWHRTNATQETDGFQVKRPGDENVKCTLLLLLDYQPMQFKLDSRLARLLGIHTATRPTVISALWNYIKDHKLQDPHQRELINCDRYLMQIFDCVKMKFADIPQRLHPLLHPPDPIVINHLISVDGTDHKKTACYDIDVETDDTMKTQMNNFLLSTTSQQDIASLDTKIHETVETINQLKNQREFMLEFASDPQEFIQKWIVSQGRDLKLIGDVAGNPEEERRADFFFKDWTQEAACRYFYSKVQQKRHELETNLNGRG